MSEKKADFSTANHGSIWLVHPQTIEAQRWLFETAPDEAQFLGSALIVEPRYVMGVLEAAEDAGFQCVSQDYLPRAFPLTLHTGT